MVMMYWRTTLGDSEYLMTRFDIVICFFGGGAFFVFRYALGGVWVVNFVYEHGMSGVLAG